MADVIRWESAVIGSRNHFDTGVAIYPHTISLTDRLRPSLSLTFGGAKGSSSVSVEGVNLVPWFVGSDFVRGHASHMLHTEVF